MDDAEIKEMVRTRYGGIASASEANCCAPASSSCCGPEATPQEKARRMGYSEAELAAIPESANLGLGCGNPQAIAAMQPGEIILISAARRVRLLPGGAAGRRHRSCDRRRHDP